MTDDNAFTFGSCCNGIGAFAWGLERAGWKCKWAVEIDPDCRRVMAARMPHVKQYEDVRDVGRANLEPVRLVLTSPPCQDWSVAGRRAGLAGERAPIFRESVRIARELSTDWLLFENVPGLHSSDEGYDFAHVLGTFTGNEADPPPGGWQSIGFGYGPQGAVAWRILDAKGFGVAQRRRRVFALVRFGDAVGLAGAQSREDAGRIRGLPWRVLTVGESLQRHSQKGKKKGTRPTSLPGMRPDQPSGAARPAETPVNEVAYTLKASCRGTGDGSGQGWSSDYVVGEADTATALRARDAKGSPDSDCTQTLIPMTFSELGQGHQTYRDTDEAHSLRSSPTGGLTATLVTEGRAAFGGASSEERNEAAAINAHPGGRYDFDTENFVVEQSVAIMAHSKKHGHAMTTQQAAESGQLVVEQAVQPFNIIGLGQQGKNHAYPTETSGCLQHKGLSASGNEAGTLIVEQATGYTVHGTPASEVASETQVASALRARVPGMIENSTTTVVVEAAQRHGNNIGPPGALRAGNGGLTGGVPFIATQEQSFRFVGGAQQDEIVTPDQIVGTLAHANNHHQGHHQPKVVVPYTVNAAESCAKKDHAFETETARSLDTSGGFASGQGGNVVAFAQNQRNEVRDLDGLAGALAAEPGMKQQTYLMETVSALGASGADGRGHRLGADEAAGGQVIAQPMMQVRRLTVTECLRLMALPDDYLDVEPRLSDSTMYRMIGNSGVWRIIAYIAERIKLAEKGELK